MDIQQRFDYHLKQHDSQTEIAELGGGGMFDYHLKQHDSQTNEGVGANIQVFDYHLKQHDSQTGFLKWSLTLWFDYHLKQHDSQTSNESIRHDRALCCFRWFSHTWFYFRGFPLENQHAIHKNLRL